MISKACIVGAYQKKLEELARFDDVELTVIVPPYWRDERGVMPLERVYTAGYRFIVEPMLLNGHFHLHFYPGLGKHVRRLQPDIVHIDEEPYNLATFQAMRLAKRAGARALFFTWQNLKRIYPFPFSFIESYNLKKADYAIAGNQEAVEVWRGKGYKGPIKVIPQFGVDPEIYKPQITNRESRIANHESQISNLKSPTSNLQSPFSIGYVGRLVEEKGVQVLLQAVDGLAGEWRLHILGSGPMRSQLEALAQRLGVADRVTFESPIPSAQMPTFYNQLDTLVLPSLTRPHWKEQFGRVLIEAMACGVPVVGSRSGEIPYVIGQAGLTFTEGDIQELRAKLSQLMDAPALCADLARRGRERVLAHYTQAKITAETHEVYRQLLTPAG
jgi:glycosyltransferase involved in cell wall biosynthesis